MLLRVRFLVVAVMLLFTLNHPAFSADTDRDALFITLLKQAPKEGDAQNRAAMIDQLGQDYSKQAIPVLIDCLSDARALMGSDNWVGGHAANALQAISGEDFGIDTKKWREWYKASLADAETQPIFSVRVEFAHGASVDVPRLKEGQRVGLVVTIINNSDQEQRLPLCGSGIWVTDHKDFYVGYPPEVICKTQSVAILAPHSMFPGAILLELGHTAPPNATFSEKIRIGILPAAEFTCNAIFPGHGRCGNANSSWSDPISLSP